MSQSIIPPSPGHIKGCLRACLPACLPARVYDFGGAPLHSSLDTGDGRQGGRDQPATCSAGGREAADERGTGGHFYEPAARCRKRLHVTPSVTHVALAVVAAVLGYVSRAALVLLAALLEHPRRRW